APCACAAPLTIAAFPAGASRFLQTTIGSSPMSPRLAITQLPTAALAIDSQTVGGHPPADFAAPTHTHTATHGTDFATAAVTAVSASNQFALANHAHVIANGSTTGFLSSADWNTFSTGTIANARLSGTYSSQLALTNVQNTYAGTFVGTLGNVGFS